MFAYYGGTEKVGDGYERHAASLLVLADPVERPALLEDDALLPPDVPRRLRLGRLDLDDDTDWDEVRELVETSYRLTAGARRVRRLDA